MRKIILAVMAVGILGTGVFLACEKEKNPMVDQQSQTEKVKLDKSNLLSTEQLIDQTGIDIHELSMRPYIVDFASTLVTNVNTLISQSTISSSELSQMQALVDEIQQISNEGNYDAMYSRFEHLSKIITRHGGYFHNNVFYGLQDFDFNGKKYSIPVNYMTVMQEEAKVLWNAITTDYPSIVKLDIEWQKQILSEALKIELRRRDGLPYQGDLKGCLQSAHNEATAAMSIATLTFTLGMAQCGVFILPWAIGACLAGNAALYAYNIYSAQSAHNTAVENCHFRYGN
jgi:hypothetical protein